jgi:hypothetical protein
MEHNVWELATQADHILNIHDVSNIWHVPLLLRVSYLVKSWFVSSYLQAPNQSVYCFLMTLLHVGFCSVWCMVPVGSHIIVAQMRMSWSSHCPFVLTGSERTYCNLQQAESKVSSSTPSQRNLALISSCEHHQSLHFSA